MRKFVLTLVAGILLGFCNAQETFKINGTITGVPAGETYLINVNKGVFDTLARAEIKDGKFLFEVKKVEEPTVVALGIKDMPEVVSICLENVDVVVNINAVQFNKSTVQGGSQQVLWNKYVEINTAWMQKRMEASGKMMQAKSKEEADAAQKVMAQMIAEHNAAIDEFIQTNADSSVAAYIASRVGHYNKSFLSKRYELLSEKGKATQYGKLLGEHIASMK